MGGDPSHFWKNFLSLSLWSGDLGHTGPRPPPPILLNSWRLVAGGNQGDLPTFPLGIFSPPHLQAFLSSPSALLERRHPGPERVLQFNYFQILCSGHPRTPLSAIESWAAGGCPSAAQA